MAIMIAAKAASSTEDANHDIMSVSEPEACMHGYGERRMSIMNEVHDIMSISDIVMRRDEKYMELLEQIEDYWTDRAEGYSQVNQEELAGDNRTNWRRELERHFPENRTDSGYRNRSRIFFYYSCRGRLPGDRCGLYRSDAGRS